MTQAGHPQTLSELSQSLFASIGVAVSGNELADPDQLATRLAAAGWSLGPWLRLPEKEYGDDSLALDHMLGGMSLAGPVLVYSEATILRGGGFVIAPEDLVSFVQAHRSRFGEVLFNGDAALIGLAAGVAVLYQHDGIYTRAIRSDAGRAKPSA